VSSPVIHLFGMIGPGPIDRNKLRDFECAVKRNLDQIKLPEEQREQVLLAAKRVKANATESTALVGILSCGLDYVHKNLSPRPVLKADSYFAPAICSLNNEWIESVIQSQYKFDDGWEVCLAPEIQKANAFDTSCLTAPPRKVEILHKSSPVSIEEIKIFYVYPHHDENRDQWTSYSFGIEKEDNMRLEADGASLKLRERDDKNINQRFVIHAVNSRGVQIKCLNSEMFWSWKNQRNPYKQKFLSLARAGSESEVENSVSHSSIFLSNKEEDNNNFLFKFKDYSTRDILNDFKFK